MVADAEPSSDFRHAQASHSAVVSRLGLNELQKVISELQNEGAERDARLMRELLAALDETSASPGVASVVNVAKPLFVTGGRARYMSDPRYVGIPRSFEKMLLGVEDGRKEFCSIPEALALQPDRRMAERRTVPLPSAACGRM